MLIYIVILLAFLYFREASPTQPTNPPKQTSAPTTGQQSVTGNGDFSSVLAQINTALSTLDHTITTVVEKN